MMNRHLIIATYRGPTNTRGARIMLRSERYNETLLIPYDHECRDAGDVAIKWLRANGYTIESCAEMSHSYAYMVKEFVSLHSAKEGKRWEYAPTSPGLDPVESLRELLTFATGNHQESRAGNPWGKAVVKNAARALRNADGLDPYTDSMDVRYTAPEYMTPEY